MLTYNKLSSASESYEKPQHSPFEIFHGRTNTGGRNLSTAEFTWEQQLIRGGSLSVGRLIVFLFGLVIGI